MSRSQSTRRVVLPQAMRVIVPPTGNEAIAMVKDTSLLSAIPIITELFYQTSAIGNRTLLIMPAFVAATAWYLIIGSIMMPASTSSRSASAAASAPRAPTRGLPDRPGQEERD